MFRKEICVINIQKIVVNQTVKGREGKAMSELKLFIKQVNKSIYQKTIFISQTL